MKLFDFLSDLKRHVTGELRTDDYTRVLYSTDASIYQVMPHAVLLPRTVEDVQAAVELATQYHVPILARAGGTSLAGQAVNEALVIDVSRYLDQVLELNQEEHWVRVRPGIVLDELNATLRPYNLQFGPDPASSNRACLGGIVSNNSTGSHSILYGMTADHVLEMEVVLSDGTAAHFGAEETGDWRLEIERLGDWETGRLEIGEELQSAIGNSQLDVYRRMAALVADAKNQETIRAGTPRHWRRCGGYNLDRLLPQRLEIRDWRLETERLKEPRLQSPVSSLPISQSLNLAKLVCGAEGTLAVMTGIKLNLVPVPTHTALAVLHFDDLHAALTAVSAILEMEPAAVELLDNLSLTLCRDVPDYARLLPTFLAGQPYCVLITEFYGESERELRAKIGRLEAHLRRQQVGVTAVTAAYAPQQQKNVWAVRKVGLGLLMSIKGDRKPIAFIEDAAVPVEHLTEYVTSVERFCNDLGTPVSYYAHASAGCLHIRPLINTKKATEIAKLPEIASFAVELLKGYGGALSSEHGDGRTRSWLNERFFGPDLYRLYQEVKHIFDPHNLFNPGMVVDGGSMTANLRYGEAYHVIPLRPRLDFSEHANPHRFGKPGYNSGESGYEAEQTPGQGFDRAVEMCNGAGVCRKMGSGTMCPSFMVTREEMHSTRGRANALRAALSGRLPPGELTSPRMYEVMDLCIECKACKAECPSAVDMAKIKFEFLGRYHEVHGVPLRGRFFANVGRLNRLGSGVFAPLLNWTLRNQIVRAGMERFLGISGCRTLPPLAARSFMSWFKSYCDSGESQPEPGGSGYKLQARTVVLFIDPFTNYNYPEVGMAATEFSQAAGWRVLAVAGDDGRPFISKGLVEQARTAASRVVKMLAPFAEQGLPIVGLEPSSLLTLRDEYLYLLPGDGRVRLVADHALTFEEFVGRAADAGQLNVTFTNEARQVLLHGHCHQKALVGTGPSKRTLSLPANYTVTEVDSGCCGMAGSFGYEAEHYELSLKMAERRLLPAVREAAAETIVVAAGLSCRQQIEHGSGCKALHPAQVLRAAMFGSGQFQ